MQQVGPRYGGQAVGDWNVGSSRKYQRAAERCAKEGSLFLPVMLYFTQVLFNLKAAFRGNLMAAFFWQPVKGANRVPGQPEGLNLP
jgi:hypothetical protein